MVASFNALDVAVIVGYFTVHAAIAAYFTCRRRGGACSGGGRSDGGRAADGDSDAASLTPVAVSSHGAQTSSRGRGHSSGSSASAAEYFLAGRHAPWWAVGCSFFASNIGSETLVGLSGNGARYGMSVATFDWASPLFFLALAYVFAPFFSTARVFTTNEWIGRRFNKACRTYLAAASLVMYVVTKLSLSLVAGGVVLQSLLGWDMWTSIVTLVVVTGLYVAGGGMSAVIYTEVVQTMVLLGGTCALMVASLDAVGGISGLRAQVDDKYQHVLTADGPYPWAGLVFGYPFLSLWFHCTDQEMVQRGLTAKNDAHAKGGCILAGLFKLFPPFGFAVAGMIARVLFPSELGVGCGSGDGAGGSGSSSAALGGDSASGSDGGNPTSPSVSCDGSFDVAFPLLVERLMPHGAMGLMVAAMLAALMSTLASTFNSSSTIFVMDVYLPCMPPGSVSQAQQVRVGRIAAGVMVVLAILWTPLVYAFSETMYLAVQSVIANAAPPIATVFVLGIFVDRVNSAGALAGLVVGHATGVVRLALTVSTGRWSEHGFVHEFTHFNFLEFAAVLGLVTAVTVLAVSALTQGPATSSSAWAGLTWRTRHWTAGAGAAATASTIGGDDGSVNLGGVEMTAGGDGGDFSNGDGGGGGGADGGADLRQVDDAAGDAREGGGDEAAASLMQRRAASPPQSSWERTAVAESDALHRILRADKAAYDHRVCGISVRTWLDASAVALVACVVAVFAVFR